MAVIDTRGMSCPQPVLMTKKAVAGSASSSTVEVLVDNAAALGNVTRFLKSAGFKTVDAGPNGEDTLIRASK
jgi:TusA-related sulfurtransferase